MKLCNVLLRLLSGYNHKTSKKKKMVSSINKNNSRKAILLQFTANSTKVKSMTLYAQTT